jgi:hypothetical protein
MRTGQQIQFAYPAIIRKQWIAFALLTGATGLILAALSVGLALPTWRLLFQAIKQFPTLQAQQGMSADGFLLTLLVQAGFSLAAWTLFIWIAGRAVMRLRTTEAQIATRLTTQPAMAPGADTFMPHQPVASPQAAHPFTMQPPAGAAANTSVPASSLAPTILPPAVVQQPPALAPSNAATVLAPQPILPRVQVTLMPEQPGVPETKTLVQRSSPAQHTPVPPPSMPEVTSQQATRGVHPAQALSTNATILPRQTFPSSPGVREQEQPSSPSLQPKTPGRQQREQKDPFAVNEDAVKMFLQGDALSAPKEQAKSGQAAPGMPGAEFVFGNPFEGLLPDVFEHDEDLKRSVKEQQRTIYPDSLSGEK